MTKIYNCNHCNKSGEHINWKHNHNVPEFLISNSIVLSASMFGAIYLFSTSLIGMNKKWIKQEKSEVTAFKILNGTIMFLSGGVVFFTSVKAFDILINKYCAL